MDHAFPSATIASALVQGWVQNSWRLLHVAEGSWCRFPQVRGNFLVLRNFDSRFGLLSVWLSTIKAQNDEINASFHKCHSQVHLEGSWSQCQRKRGLWVHWAMLGDSGSLAPFTCCLEELPLVIDWLTAAAVHLVERWVRVTLRMIAKTSLDARIHNVRSASFPCRFSCESCVPYSCYVCLWWPRVCASCKPGSAPCVQQRVKQHDL